MPAVSKTLIEKIEALPAERIAEIEDFVDFIRSREQEQSLTATAAAAAASVPAFAAVCGAIPKTTSTMPFEFGDVILVSPFRSSQDRSSRSPGESRDPPQPWIPASAGNAEKKG